MTLGEGLARRDNALNVIRLALAATVLVSHTWPLGGWPTEPHLGGRTIGSWAVAGFFAISGYLIPASRAHQHWWRYAQSRAMRILPALWVCLLAVALVYAPLAALFSGTEYHPLRALTYVASNLTTHVGQTSIGSSLDSAHIRDWIGSLWSLIYETYCYIIAGVLLTLPVLRRNQAATALTVLLVSSLGGHLVYMWLLSCFSAGWLIATLAHRLRASWPLIVVAVGAVILSTQGPTAAPALPLAYLVLSLGALLPGRGCAINDVSYGTYLYAFSTPQLLFLAHAPVLGLPFYLGASLAITLLLATASWFLIEKRCRPRRRTAAPTPDFRPVAMSVAGPGLPRHRYAARSR